MPPAIFLDRDGVLIDDVELIVDSAQARILPGVAEALARLRSAGYLLVVVSNQTVVARGMATEADIDRFHDDLQRRLVADGAAIDVWRFCPHHPHANLEQYQTVCACRKPKPGMLLEAAEHFDIQLAESFMIGDRPTDIAAGIAAGCRTVLVRTGRHLAPLIVGGEAAAGARADYECDNLLEAAAWICAAGVPA